MANAFRGKRLLAAAALGCTCALVAAPAYAYYHVHDDEVAAADGNRRHRDRVHRGPDRAERRREDGGCHGPRGQHRKRLPEGGRDVQREPKRAGRHPRLQRLRLADDLSGEQYTCTVHKAASQKPGTQTTYDSEGSKGEDTPLERWDSVVVTVA